jgi:exosortase/archaeosortase family protein
MILPYCSSMANVSLAFLAWVTITKWLPHRWSPQDLWWCFLAAASVVAVNVGRIGLMGLSQEHYRTVHSQLGDTVTNLLLLGLTVGICLLGARRDLFIRT